MINNIFEVEHNPHYVNRYLKLINSIKELGERTHLITEKHHILPGKLWPEFKNFRQNKWNMVRLTYREHFIVHLILVKCFDKKNKAKMIHAFNMMLNPKTRNQNRNDKVKNSEYYQNKETEWFEKFGRGENHPHFGRKFTEEHKRKISEAAKLRKGELNSNFGKRHKFSEEKRKKYV